MLSDHLIENVPRRRKLIINITSLIDVLFLLLIFFMVSSTFVQNTALKVSLPSVKGEIIIDKKKSLDVVITKKSEIFLNGSKVEFKEFKNRLKALTKNLKEQNPDIHFKVDEEVSYGFAVKVMGELKSSGIKTLMAITESKNE